MKHKFKNGKWMPENGTFVSVPNEQIPEVIQMLRDNGYDSYNTLVPGDSHLVLNNKFWCPSNGLGERHKLEIPFPDFKALVTGKFPESWCIQYTEESMKHEAWIRCLTSLGVFVTYLDNWYGQKEEYAVSTEPFGEVLQIETWAALNPVEETTEKPCTCKPVPADAFPDEPLIRVLKSRGYTISKTY